MSVKQAGPISKGVQEKAVNPHPSTLPTIAEGQAAAKAVQPVFNKMVPERKKTIQKNLPSSAAGKVITSSFARELGKAASVGEFVFGDSRPSPSNIFGATQINPMAVALATGGLSGLAGGLFTRRNKDIESEGLRERDYIQRRRNKMLLAGLLMGGAGYGAANLFNTASRNKARGAHPLGDVLGGLER